MTVEEKPEQIVRVIRGMVACGCVLAALSMILVWNAKVMGKLSLTPFLPGLAALHFFTGAIVGWFKLRQLDRNSHPHP